MFGSMMIVNSLRNNPSEELMRPAAASVINLTRLYPSLAPGAYRRLWLGIIPYHFAFQIGLIATGVAAVALSRSALEIGLMVGAWGLPILFLPPFGGVAADRYSRRRTMLTAQLVLGSAAVAVGVLALTGILAVWHLIGLGLVQGATYAFFAPARTAYTARAVEARLVANAVAAYSLSEHTAAVLGPALGGLLVATPGIGAGWAFISVGVTHAIIWLWFRDLPDQPTSIAASRSHVLAEILEGMRYARRLPPLRVVLALSAMAMLLAMPFRQLMPVFAEQVHGAGPAGLGTLLAASGAGAILGSIGVSQLRGDGQVRHLPGILGTLFGVTALAFALAPSYSMAIFLAALAGAAAAAFTTTNSAIIATAPDRAFYGRAASLYQLTFALGPLGAIPIAALADRIGAPEAVAAGGLLLAITSPIVARVLGAGHVPTPPTHLLEEDR